MPPKERKDNMKILVVGAGIVGTIYGWAIAEAGHDVTHFVRAGRAARLSEGVSIDMLDRRKGHKKQFIGHYKPLVLVHKENSAMLKV